MNPLIQLKRQLHHFSSHWRFSALGFSHERRQSARHLPGGYPNFTTAAGDHALQALTLGLANTAIGKFWLFSVTTGSSNTTLGAGALDLNTADSNAAIGAAALLFNTTAHKTGQWNSGA